MGHGTSLPCGPAPSLGIYTLSVSGCLCSMCFSYTPLDVELREVVHHYSTLRLPNKPTSQ